MSITLIVLLIFFIVLLALSVPIAFGIGVANILAIIADGSLPIIVLPQRIYSGIDSFALLAVPLFIISGDIMMKGGISKRLINLATAIFGWSKYCLAYVTVAASAFFAAISGSAPATNAAIGGMMYKEMIKNKYDPDFAAFLGAMSGTLGPLIPPSIIIVVLSTMTGISVTSMFKSAAICGVLLAIVYCLTAKFCIRHNHDIIKNEKPTTKSVWIAFKDAVWGLISPLIILGGIYSGYFTATEAAVIAVVYSIIIGLFVYKELTVKDLINTLIESSLTSAMVLLLIGVSSCFSWLLTVEGVGAMMGDIVSNFGLSKNLFLVSVIILLLILGCFIETMPIVTLTVPIFYPIAMGLGIDPVQFGIVTIFTLSIGIVTPPFGVNLYVSAGYSKRDILVMSKKGIPFFISAVAMIILFAFFPGMYTWLL